MDGDDPVATFRHDLEASVVGRHIMKLTEKCKSLARTIKSVPYTQWLANPNFREAVPPRAMADILVEFYFKISESVYRIIHIPSFRQEYEQYWQNPNAASPTFILKLLLAMSIGTLLYQGQDATRWRTEAIKWIFAAQAWLSSPFEKSRLHTAAIQLQCLLLLARQHHSVAGDLVWISAGSLLRTALQMGYHRDPKVLPKMSALQAETRRRLWATILEINLQSALDSGMPLLLSLDDFDTEPPANIDDADMNESTVGPISSKPSHIFTSSSIQIALLKSFPLRLEVVRFANNLRAEPAYDDVLLVGSSLSKALKENTSFISRVNRLGEPLGKVSQLQQNLFDLSVRRFLLLVHRPFAAKGLNDPHFYFSRKICLDTAITMLKYPCSDYPLPGMASDGTRDDYSQLKTISGGFFKSIMVHVSMVIFAELWSQIEEDTIFSEQSKASREPLKQCLRDAITLSVNRITEVENNIKGNLFMSLTLAQIDALEEGIDPSQSVLDAATKSADRCYDMLVARYSAMNGSIPPSNNSTNDTLGFWGGQDFGMDFTMQDWTLDPESNQDSWFKSGFEDGAWWHY
jgi:Fungal specific transcription factor domain